MTLVQPANKQNAIKIAAFAFELQPENITQHVLEKIQKNYTNGFFSSSYDNLVQHTEMVVKITESEKKITNDTLGGLSLLKIDTEGNKIWEVLIDKNNIVVTCYEYTRWEEVFTQTKTYLKEIIGVIGLVSIRGLTLEYIDEFNILDSTNNKWKEELFLSETKYLPKHIFKLLKPWHSHHGFFLDGKKTLNKRILLNLNIEYVVSNQDTYKLIIRSQHRSLMENAIHFNTENIDSKIDEAMVENHEINKDLLRDLLTIDALQSINLGESNA